MTREIAVFTLAEAPLTFRTVALGLPTSLKYALADPAIYPLTVFNQFLRRCLTVFHLFSRTLSERAVGASLTFLEGPRRNEIHFNFSRASDATPAWSRLALLP